MQGVPICQIPRKMLQEKNVKYMTLEMCTDITEKPKKKRQFWRLLTFTGQCIVHVFLKYTNKMQRYAVFFITVNDLQISGGFSAHHQELKNCTQSIGYMSSLLAATASGSSKQA
jgi:hypothetical protein